MKWDQNSMISRLTCQNPEQKPIIWILYDHCIACLVSAPPIERSGFNKRINDHIENSNTNSSYWLSNPLSGIPFNLFVSHTNLPLDILVPLMDPFAWIIWMLLCLVRYCLYITNTSTCFFFLHLLSPYLSPLGFIANLWCVNLFNLAKIN